MISPTVERIQLAPGFWSSLRRLGIEARDIARQAQLPTSLIQQPSFTIEPYFAIWQAYSDLIGDVGTAIVKLATAFETARGEGRLEEALAAQGGDFVDFANRTIALLAKLGLPGPYRGD